MKMKYKAVLALQKDGKVFACESVAEYQFWKLHKDTVEMREIEWETIEPVITAAYLVRQSKRFYNDKGQEVLDNVWFRERHPIGQQPEGSVMVPGSERNG
jgi:hypothetical protein